MIHHQAIQGSEEWNRLRMGRPRASEFEYIITPGKWEPTKGAARRNYMMRLLTELILDTPLSGVTTAAMEHGHASEPRSRAAYEMLHGVDVELCGFCTNDEGTIGCSPDGLVGEDGLVEFKNPDRPEIHVGYLSDPETLKQEYFVQVQGQMYVTGRQWTDLVSYFSGIEMVTIRVLPDPEFQEKLKKALDLFVNDFALLVDRAKTKGWIKTQEPTTPRDHSKDFLSDEDVEQILAARRAAQPTEEQK